MYNDGVFRVATQIHGQKPTTVGAATSQGRLVTRNLEPALPVGHYPLVVGVGP
jgi:hypothetical protein